MVNESNAPAPLSMAVVPQSFLNGLMDEVREVKSLLQKKSEEEVNSQWIESTQVRKPVRAKNLCETCRLREIHGGSLHRYH